MFNVFLEQFYQIYHPFRSQVGAYLGPEIGRLTGS